MIGDAAHPPLAPAPLLVLLPILLLEEHLRPLSPPARMVRWSGHFGGQLALYNGLTMM